MLYNLLINIINLPLLGFISLLPNADSSILTFIDSSTAGLKALLVNGNVFFPVSEMMTMLGIMVGLEFLLFGWKLIKFIVTTLTLGLVRLSGN
jgi:hypothetical protein